MVHCYILYEEGIEKTRNQVNQYKKLRRIIIASNLQEALMKVLMSLKKPYDRVETNFLKCFKRAWYNSNFADENDATISSIIDGLKYMTDGELLILQKKLNEAIECEFVELKKRVTFAFYFEEHSDLFKIKGLVIN